MPRLPEAHVLVGTGWSGSQVVGRVGLELRIYTDFRVRFEQSSGYGAVRGSLWWLGW